jgi:hypothetical protein
VPSAHAHLYEDGGDGAQEPSPWDHPIRLADIDQILEESAGVEHAGGVAPIRVRRDELTLVLEALAYARWVLASDVALLRHCLATGGSDSQTVVDELPKVMASQPWGEGWSAPCDPGDSSWMEREVFVRCDQLMSTHLEMARTDLSSPDDVTRQLERLEQQLTVLTERQDAVVIRLTRIRAAIVRQYHEGAVASRSWPG